jgi:hypothetical protein
MPSNALSGHYQPAQSIPFSAVGNAEIAILVEVAPGRAALLPAERQGKGITPLRGGQALLSGSPEPGGQLWRDLTEAGWKWVQDGAFGQKYWRHDRVETNKKPGRQ